MPTLESLTQLDDILLDFLVEGVAETIIRETTGHDWMKKSKKNVYGRNILMKTRTKGNAGAGVAPERGTLPRGKFRKFEEMTQKVRWFYAPVEITGQEIHVPHGKKGAVLDIVVDAFEDTLENAQHKADNYFWNDGSGRYAQIAGSPSYAAGTGLTTVAFDNGIKEFFLEGQDVSFGTNSTLWEVDYISETADEIFVTGDCTAEATDDVWIYNGGDYASGFDVAPWGVKILCTNDNGVHANFQGHDRTAAGKAWTQAYVNDNSGSDRVLSSILLTQHLQYHKRRAGNRTPTKIFTEDGVLNSYILLLESVHQQIAVMPSETGTKERYSYIFGGKKMVLESSMKCPQGYIYFLDDRGMELREAYPFQWDKEGGGKLTKERQEDVFWGRMKWYYNYISRNPKLLSVLTDVKRNSITA